ncbi:MAG: transcriptional regulator NrdR [Clostridiales bacterium]|jgi:transcriptional repressor NrdR|nr:transcriptional regulator NrdR [Clostridiales bacterium]
MKCSYCGCLESKVTDSRETTHDSIRRRRECLACGKRFTTYEFVDKEQLAVIKNNGLRRPFELLKIRAGIDKACEKRSIPVERIDKLLSDLEHKLYSSLDSEITTKEIGKLVMQELKNLDDVAYIRFASVYQKFADVASFIDFINEQCKECNE